MEEQSRPRAWGCLFYGKRTVECDVPNLRTIGRLMPNLRTIAHWQTDASTQLSVFKHYVLATSRAAQPAQSIVPAVERARTPKQLSYGTSHGGKRHK